MLSVIILAAGQSKRMKSSLSKVLHPLGGLPMIQHVFNAVLGLDPRQVIAVISPSLQHHPFLGAVTTVIQDQPLGTGHAVQCAVDSIEDQSRDVLILCGDTPLIRPETLKHLMEIDADLALVAMPLDTAERRAQPYGRILLDDKGVPLGIVEYKDATDQMRESPLANAGVYKVKASLLREILPQLNNKNTTGEYYLTDMVGLFYERGHSVKLIQADEEEFLGINTRAELARAESILQHRWRANAMENGVTLVQPETIFFAHDTHVEKDCRIGPFVTFGPGVKLHENVTVMSFCHLEHTVAESGVTIGPFAHTRGNSVFLAESSIGNFVEVKGSVIGKKSKAKHLSYIGDSDIGDSVNIGAGTITCNYDGYKKSRTIIGAGSFIGANSTLIAPIKIGEGVIVAAGSTVTKDVPDGSLAIARPPQAVKVGWARTFHDKNRC
ncbi:MAG: bifunctional UDP-N-acetylglucosamine diphosphorylase/glucosamine-1-phosphate N-acetyltransferase GlmU [Alphaproteobacteria bacterium]|nr:bifunctional UDP-N-acetylglucosamine diphosphorylase/glucosamine-1-phosphate N-acetyltransferase GlmU [Alphaproteobacteria bacterium]